MPGDPRSKLLQEVKNEPVSEKISVAKPDHEQQKNLSTSSFVLKLSKDNPLVLQPLKPKSSPSRLQKKREMKKH